MVEVSKVSFVCPICGESKFSTKSIFLRHLKILVLVVIHFHFKSSWAPPTFREFNLHSIISIYLEKWNIWINRNEIRYECPSENTVD